jgi:hypothetical protein
MKNPRRRILNRIIEKGGLYGYVAISAIHDPKKGDLFITECFEQCQHESVWDHWGPELTMDIINYRLTLLRGFYDRVKSLERQLQKDLIINVY